jgi:3-(3-hydroxy-phenyl)propionate hydroxylase
VRELTGRLKAAGAIICERDPAKARARDSRLLAECGGVVRDTPRQDVLPKLVTGLLSAPESSGRGTLFPQPRLAGGELMDSVCGTGWRLVLDATLAVQPSVPGLTVISLASESLQETEGVVAAWMARHGCHAALVRPDHYVYGTATNESGIEALVAEQRRALGN